MIRCHIYLSPSNGMGYAQRKKALELFVRGWVEYYKLAEMKLTVKDIDGWLRRRIRMCIWKSRKKTTSFSSYSIALFWKKNLFFSKKILIFAGSNQFSVRKNFFNTLLNNN